jgi:uncharacterized membrane protein YeaQ/YmgE (transglycosylase-associated protein family)
MRLASRPAPTRHGLRSNRPAALMAARVHIRGKSMHILVWILFGLVVGVVAKLLMPGRDPGGFILTIVLGIVGAFIGGIVGRMLGWYRDGDPVGFVMAVLGAVVVLAVYRMTVGRTA